MGNILAILIFLIPVLCIGQNQFHYTPPVDAYSGTELYCSASVQDSSTILVDWTGNYTKVSYIVQKNTGSGWVSLDTVQASPYSDTSVTEKVWNRYRVKATNAGRIVKTSNEITMPVWWAYSLEGVDGDSLTASGISKLDITGAYSVEAIIEIDSFIAGVDTTRIVTIDGTGGRLTLGFADNNRYLGLYYSSDTLLAVTSENEIGSSPQEYSGTFTTKKLIHIVAACDGVNGVKFYVDGDEIATTIDLSPIVSDITGNYNVAIGGGGNVTFYLVRLYNSELSATQIDSLWNGGAVDVSNNVGFPVIDLTFQSDTLSGSTYTVVDAAATPANFTSVGTEGDERILSSNFRNSFGMNTISIPSNGSASVDVRSGPWADDAANNGPFGPPSLIQPKVWWMGAGKTLVFFTDKAAHGGNKRAAYLIVDHANNTITRHWYGGIQSDGIVDTHPQVSGVAYNGKIVTLQEDRHTSPIYVRTSDASYPSSLSLSSIVNENGSAYPSLQILNDTLFALWRDTGNGLNSCDRVYFSTDGETFTRIGTKLVDLTTGWAYPFSFPHQNKISLMIGYAAGGGVVDESYYIESTDGDTWQNIQGTFSKKISTEGYISLTELQDNALVEADNGIDGGAGAITAAVTPDGTQYFVSANDTVTYEVHWYADGWNHRAVNFPNSNGLIDVAICPIDNNSFYWFEVETRSGYDVIVKYRTDDTFQTFDSGEVISDIDKDYTQPSITANSYDTDIVTLVANEITSSDRANIFIYNFRK